MNENGVQAHYQIVTVWNIGQLNKTQVQATSHMMTHPHPQNLFSGIKRGNWEQSGQDYFGTIVVCLPTNITIRPEVAFRLGIYAQWTNLPEQLWHPVCVTSSFNEVQHKLLLLVEKRYINISCITENPFKILNKSVSRKGSQTCFTCFS